MGLVKKTHQKAGLSIRIKFSKSGYQQCEA